MIDPNVFLPDFQAEEKTSQDGVASILTISNDELATYANFRGDKEPGDTPPYVMLTWQTPLELAEAFDLIDNAQRFEGLEATRGTLTARSIFAEDDLDSDWVPPGRLRLVTDDPQAELFSIVTKDVAALDLALDNGNLVGWAKLFRSPPRHYITAGTTDIHAEWLRDLYAFTVDAPTHELIGRNLGNIVAALEAFTETPFGTPVLGNPAGQE